MAYKVIILYQLYMPSYFLGTFTEYPKVVCAYGGSIRLESELGIGSKFTITIPQ